MTGVFFLPATLARVVEVCMQNKNCTLSAFNGVSVNHQAIKGRRRMFTAIKRFVAVSHISWSSCDLVRGHKTGKTKALERGARRKISRKILQQKIHITEAILCLAENKNHQQQVLVKTMYVWTVSSRFFHPCPDPNRVGLTAVCLPFSSLKKMCAKRMLRCTRIIVFLSEAHLI